MIWLIGQLAIWLLLTAALAALAGWAFAEERAAPREDSRRREREHLLRDLVRYAGDGSDAPLPDRDDDGAQRLLGLRDARIAELERLLETARSRADELSGQLAEQQRRGVLNAPDAEELERLRARERERERTVDAEAEPVEDEARADQDENIALQAWRLRYFEQRVKYLENIARSAAPAPAVALVGSQDAAPVHEWAAREARARAAFLEDELRARQALGAPPVGETTPFAANADVDMMLRWRMLYLERRVAHLQSDAASAPAPFPVVSETAFDPDRWKWRARYLEARVRHLETRAHAQPARAEPAPAPAAEAPQRIAAAPVPARRAKPPVLASARNGAPDDLTLIEGVSLLQQTTLYSLGVFHFDQIAGWSEENVAWVDQYLRLQGRIGDEEWVEQARDLARDGPAAARRVMADEETS